MSTVSASPEVHKTLFVEEVAPIVARHARVVFRHLRRCEADHAEAIEDCLAHAWEGYVSAIQAGKQPWHFPFMLATYAARRTSIGRKVGKRMKAKDVFSAARSDRISLRSLEDQRNWHEALEDDTETPVPEQVAFRLDFPAWLTTLSDRNRKVALTLSEGHSAKEVANRFQLSPGRVTQLRQQLMREWEAFIA